MMYGIGWGTGLGGWIMMLGGVALVVGLVLLIALAAGGRQGISDERTGGPDKASAILRERYARGEITEAEYEQGRKILGL